MVETQSIVKAKYLGLQCHRVSRGGSHLGVPDGYLFSVYSYKKRGRKERGGLEGGSAVHL